MSENDLLELDIETRTLGYEVRFPGSDWTRRYRTLGACWSIAGLVNGAEIWRIDQLPDGTETQTQVM